MAWFRLVEHANGVMFDPLGHHVSGRRWPVCLPLMRSART